MKQKLSCLAVLMAGTLILLLCGGEPPAWLLKLEVLVFSMAALAFGFTAFVPSAPAWIWSQPVIGTICINLGVASMFIPPQFIVSAVFLGVGTRMVMRSIPSIRIVGKNDVAIRETGCVAKR